MMKDNEQNQRRDKWHRIVDEYLDSDITQKAFGEVCVWSNTYIINMLSNHLHFFHRTYFR